MSEVKTVGELHPSTSSDERLPSSEMAELLPQCNWIISRLSCSFGLAYDTGETIIREVRNSSKLREFLVGKSLHYFCFIPSKSGNEYEEDKYVDIRLDKGSSVIEIPLSYIPETFKDRLRALFLIRTASKNNLTSSDSQSEFDENLGFVEVPASLLDSLNTVLVNIFFPIIKEDIARNPRDLPLSSRNELISEFQSLCSLLNYDEVYEKQKKLKEKPYLTDRDREALKEAVRRVSDLDINAAIEKKDAELICHLADLWCLELEDFMDIFGINDEEKVGTSPRDEINFWEVKQKFFSSLIKRDDLLEFGNNILRISERLLQGSSWYSIPPHLKDKCLMNSDRIRAIQQRIAASIQEAEENLKFLHSLDILIEPLYIGNPSQILLNMKDLLASISVVSKMAPHYGTPSNLSRLLYRISHQILVNCQKFILNEHNLEDSIWSLNFERLISHLDLCRDIYKDFMGYYKELIKPLYAGLELEGNIDSNKPELFEDLELFYRRINKLKEMFLCIQHYVGITQLNIDGMEQLEVTFKEFVEEFASKRHALLDYRKARFDRDYVEFSSRMNHIDDELQGIMIKAVVSANSASSLLETLNYFLSFPQREQILRVIESCIAMVFEKLLEEFQMIKTHFEEFKDRPIILDNIPPKAGVVCWVDYLYRRAKEPMEQLSRFGDEASYRMKVKPQFDKLEVQLKEFKKSVINEWQESYEEAVGVLDNFIVSSDCNLDAGTHPLTLSLAGISDFSKFCNELKCLHKLGAVDFSAKKVIEMSEKHQAVCVYEAQLEAIFKAFNSLEDSQSSKISRLLLKPFKSRFLEVLKAGKEEITWNSSELPAFISEVEIAFSWFEKAHEIAKNSLKRLDYKTACVQRMTLISTRQSLSESEFQAFCGIQLERIWSYNTLWCEASMEICTMMKSLIGCLRKFPPNRQSGSTSDWNEAYFFLREHYLQKFAKNAKLVMNKSLVNLLEFFSEDGRFSPVINIDIQLSSEGLICSPSFADISRSLDDVVLAVCSCINGVFNWFSEDECDLKEAREFLEGKENLERDPHFSSLRVKYLSKGLFDSRNKIVKGMFRGGDAQTFIESSHFTELKQGVNNMIKGILEDIEKNFHWLWKKSASERYEEKFSDSTGSPPNINELEGEMLSMTDYKGFVKEELGSVTKSFGVFKPSMKGLAKKLLGLCDESLEFCIGLLLKRADEVITQSHEGYEQLASTLTTQLNDISGVKVVIEGVEAVKALESERDIEQEAYLNIINMLRFYLNAERYNDLVKFQAPTALKILKEKREAALTNVIFKQDELIENKPVLKQNFIDGLKALEAEIKEFRESFRSFGQLADQISPVQAVEKLLEFKQECEKKLLDCKVYIEGEKIFGMKGTDFSNLSTTEQEITYLTLLYDLYSQVITSFNGWMEIDWPDVVKEIPNIAAKAQSFNGRYRKLPEPLKEWKAFHELKNEIDYVISMLPLLEELTKKSIMKRHWEEIEVLVGSAVFKSQDFKLKAIFDANIVDYKDAIVDICDAADKQLSIEEKLNQQFQQWETWEFIFSTWKSRDYACMLQGTKVTEIQEALEESFIVLNTLNAMKQVKPFKEKVTELLNVLSDTTDTLDRWIKVQQLWISMENLFMGGDIAAQMPQEAKAFEEIDKQWLSVLKEASSIKKVTQCCQLEFITQALPTLLSGLEGCQKSLEFYLEEKRRKFPRFYFVSDPVLLRMLASSNPEYLQKHFEKIFDSISRVEFMEFHGEKYINKIIFTGEDDEESISLNNPVKAEGSIEDWLSNLEKEMKNTIRKICRFAAKDARLIGTEMKITEFCAKLTAQTSMLGLKLAWTSDVEKSLDEIAKKNELTLMKEMGKKQNVIMSELLAACLSTLGSKLERIKYEALITTHVHQRDIFFEIFAKAKLRKIRGPSDFDWLKHTRNYWKSDREEVTVVIVDVEFSYGYEYLGVRDCLVMTPLTTRCFLTCAQALGMCYGGALFGPAGTGKTESVKDLGKALGLSVIVTNCSNQHRYKDMAKIFKGICQSGLWSCFDEFNRIELEVLSVVATQVESITLAKKQGAQKFIFPGEVSPIALIPAAAYFITMNPGYAGRQELPENLKVLFRSVCMMVSDSQFIIKVKLAAVGFKDSERLSHKLKSLYELCKRQLSSQRHYDFGLRNVLSVLRTAGKAKRFYPDVDESLLLLRSVRDVNLSKLVSEDVTLFMNLLREIFPIYEDSSKSLDKEVEKAILEVMHEKELVTKDAWMRKAFQFYEASLVRHGLMLVGPTCAGKSTIIEVLQAALTRVGRTTKVICLNPKAITPEQMYGVKDLISEEWTEGVFAAIWAKFNNKALKFNTWIVLDGPVDSYWIESLNTVLDDNKILTLSNNDRIPMTDNTRLVFEVENLNNASPATVSRAGITYLPETVLSYRPLIKSWINKYASSLADGEAHKKILSEVFERNFAEGGILTQVVKNSSPVLPICEANLVLQTLNFLNALLLARTHKPTKKRDYQVIVLFASIWGCGGLLEVSDRTQFDLLIREKFADLLPKDERLIVYDYCVSATEFEFVPWEVRTWSCPSDISTLQYHSLLIPTLDSERASFIMDTILNSPLDKSSLSFKSVLITGEPGTSKSTTILLYSSSMKDDRQVFKNTGLSYATSPERLQYAIEAEVERKSGKTFCPPKGVKLTMFLDDISMPAINEWGDQATLELLRQLIEQGGMYFLDKDKRGEFKTIVDLQYVGAMTSPDGGRNGIPRRLQSKLFSFNITPPTLGTIDNIYGTIVSIYYSSSTVSKEVEEVALKITSATLSLLDSAKRNLMPTPSKFHYIFNMRDVSRLFQGLIQPPVDKSIKPEFLVGLWKHESLRTLGDKLNTQQDKDWMEEQVNKISSLHFGSSLDTASGPIPIFANFLREPVVDPESNEPQQQFVYEPSYSLEAVKTRIISSIAAYNEENPTAIINIVLFESAIRHLLSISRIISMPRGSAMLVGIGVSGKQTLARIAAYIAQQKCFEIRASGYASESIFLNTVKEACVYAGTKNKNATLLITDTSITQDFSLDYICGLLSSGDVSGMITKEERHAISAEVRDHLPKGSSMESPQSLFNLFLEQVRSNLHIILCFSPSSSKFQERSQKFPALFDYPSIDWFLPWPEKALVQVAENGLQTAFEDSKIVVSMSTITAKIHEMIKEECSAYYHRVGQRVHVTPKTYLVFIETFKDLFKKKFSEISRLEHRVNLGLQKLKETAQNVEQLKQDLKQEEILLVESEEKATVLLSMVQNESIKVSEKSEEVSKFRDECVKKKDEVQKEQEEANKDLEGAMVFLVQAEVAVKSISAKDIVELKTVRNPTDIVRLVFDCVLLLFQRKLVPVSSEEKLINKEKVPFIHDSFEEQSKAMVLDFKFLNLLLEFSQDEKDCINDETCEFLEPYLTLKNFSAECAKKASNAAEGICKWVLALVMYHNAAKFVKPKMDNLKLQSARLDVALTQQLESEQELQSVQKALEELNNKLEEAKGSKNALKLQSLATQEKISKANKIINDLASENQRWTEQSSDYARFRKDLAGDACFIAAFLSYLGPFNHDFRLMLLKKIKKLLEEFKILHSNSLSFDEFLLEKGVTEDWSLRGLPGDDLSIQNAIIVTQALRYPLIVDPQGQAQAWIKNKEKERIGDSASQCITTLNNPRLRDQIEFCMSHGKPLLIGGIEDGLDASLFPILEKNVIKKGSQSYIVAFGQKIDYHPSFMLYMTTRLARPNFSPEVSAITSVIDFSVTIKGLEQQLLGRVLKMEQAALEESLIQLSEETSSGTKVLRSLDSQLLDKLSSARGNILDNDELISALESTKQQAKHIEKTLEAAELKKAEINQKRKQYLPVAVRGSVLYFSITDISTLCWMYSTSLYQFLEQFEYAVQNSEPASNPRQRVQNIIDYMTYYVYHYLNRGLFEHHKRTYLVLLVCRIMLAERLITAEDLQLLLNTSAFKTKKDSMKNQPKWLENNAESVWSNAIALSTHKFGKESTPFFESLTECFHQPQYPWNKWMRHSKPETLPVPKFEDALQQDGIAGEFKRLCLICFLRKDRTVVSTNRFVSTILHPRYIETIPDNVEVVWGQAGNRKPIVFILSAGSDPTAMIDELAKKKKKFPTEKVAMGEGQDVIARRMILKGFQEGYWVILQNGHLGVRFLAELEDMLRPSANINEEFRLWITSEPTNDFPIGLLQISMKVTYEPPSGIKAGMQRMFSSLVTQELLDKYEQEKWRQLVFSLSFLHCIVQERRKFGSLGWNLMYEFNDSDFEAAILFIEKQYASSFLLGKPFSWATLHYIISDVHYGGRVTDDLDRELLSAYAKYCFDKALFQPHFKFNNSGNLKNAFLYGLPESSQEVVACREYIESFPAVDQPNAFGMHENADLAHRMRESNALISNIRAINPKDSSTLLEKSVEQSVREKSMELLSRIPEDYDLSAVKTLISKLKTAAGTTEGGAQAPMNIFLMQEVQSMQLVITIVRTSLKDIINAIEGVIGLTAKIQGDIDSISSNQPPKSWIYDTTGAGISWLATNLSEWFVSFIKRVEQLNHWMHKGRPKSFWLAGFFNGQGFLTAVKQEVTRMHWKDKWMLDEVVFHTEIRNFGIEKVKDAPEEGVNIHGLYLEGASWHWLDGRLDESSKGKLLEKMPIVYLTVIAPPKEKKSVEGAYQAALSYYDCPIYKYSVRTANHLLLRVKMRCLGDPAIWKLKGVAVICISL